MNNSRFVVPIVLAVLVSIIFSVSCSSKIVLKPENSFQVPANAQDAVRVNCAGVSIMAEPGVWYGPENDGKQIIPIRITISNKSGFPIYIRYSDFFMVGVTTGNVYRALPPYHFENTVETSAKRIPDISPIEPNFVAEKFGVTFYNSEMYPEFPIWQGVFQYERLFYENYYQVWTKKRLPLRDALIQSEIPEGVLLSGGFLNGFLYFEKIKKTENQVIMNFRLCEANRGLMLEKVYMTFSVE
jgi:predicted small secreted protein